MHKVGELLKKKRLELKLELSDIERETRIKDTFIKYLEEGKYDKLPGPSYAQGFLKNYAQFLGLDTNIILPLFRREYDAQTEVALLPGKLGAALPAKRVRITLVGLALVFAFLAFLTYLVFQYRDFFGKPELNLISPVEGQVIEGDTLTVVGKTSPDATVFVNDKVITIEEDGTFEYSITILSTELTITVVAKNRSGRETKIIRQVKAKSPT